MQLKIFLLHCVRIKHLNTMKITEDNPFAFPIDSASTIAGLPTVTGFEGMTLRDYFAAKVISLSLKMILENKIDNPIGFSMTNIIEESSKYSYLIADSMLKERSKK